MQQAFPFVFTLSVVGAGARSRKTHPGPWDVASCWERELLRSACLLNKADATTMTRDWAQSRLETLSEIVEVWVCCGLSEYHRRVMPDLLLDGNAGLSTFTCHLGRSAGAAKECKNCKMPVVFVGVERLI